jgi:hypothetical protein
MNPDPGSIDGTLLIGDAVGAINPFTGEGIAQAMETGRIAADALASHLGDSCRLRAAYRDGLIEAFPETTTNVESQSWLLDRGRFFASEFWQAVSRPSSLVGRSVRRIVLEERGLGQGSAESEGAVAAKADRSWRSLECRLAVDRPLVGQVVRALRCDASQAGEAMRHYWRSLHERGLEGAMHADIVAMALGTLVVCMTVAADRSSGDVAPFDRTTERRARWAVDATAIGVADVVLALLFTLLSRLPVRLSGACARHAFEALQRLEGSMEGSSEETSGQESAAAAFAGCVAHASSEAASTV